MRCHDDPSARLPVIVLTTILAVASLLSACKPETPTDRAEWLREVTAVHFDMNIQLLAIDNIFDGAVRDPGTAQNCDPAIFRSTFDSISVRLMRLTKMPAFRDNEKIEGHIERIQEAWSHIKTLQESLWIETAEIPGLPARDRCLRTSAMLAKRIAIEKGFRGILSDTL